MSGNIDRRAFLGALAASTLAPDVLPGFPPSTLAAQTPNSFAPQPQDSDASAFAAIRDRFLFPKEQIYGNTGTLGASPVEVLEAQIDCLRTVERDLAAWPDLHPDIQPMTGYGPLPEFRAEVGRMLNAPFEDIAFVQNATMAMSFVANGLDLNPGDEILTTKEEHAGGISSWHLRARRHGLVVRELPLDAAIERGPDDVIRLFTDAITPKTRVIMFSHVTSTRGTRLPAKELCALAADHGAMSVVDGAQAVGQFVVDINAIGCDVYMTSSHKWLLAPKGTGILFVRRELQPKIWSTLVSDGFDDQTVGAFRLMHFGTGNLASVYGLRAAVRFMSTLGIQRIERWDRFLSQRLRDGLRQIPSVRLLSSSDSRFASALIAFEVKGLGAQQLLSALWRERIRVRTWADPIRAAQQLGEGVRFSAHYYVSPSDIDRVLTVVSRLA
jgi:isopenicillin-N epimerase